MKRRERAAALGREARLYVLLAAGLTIVLATTIGARTLEDWVTVFAVNLGIFVGIGGALGLCFGVVLPRIGLDVDELLGVRAIVVRMVGMAVSILGGAYVVLRLVAEVMPDALRFFPYSTVVTVAVPITVAIVVVGSVVDRWRDRAADAERERMRSELAAIHARINPHFLFNSLNTIAALIPVDAPRAEEAVLELSGLLRHTLEGSKKLWVPLSAELEATERYLSFEALRYGDRLVSTFEVDDRSRTVPVPPLILQPLVENAIKHGVRGRGRVAIRVSGHGPLRIEVEDDGDGTTDAPGTKTAHADLERRLRLVYDGRASFDVDRGGALGGYRVRLSLPTEREA